MKPLTNFLLFLAIGLALYFILFPKRKHLSFASRLFFLAGPASSFVVYAISLLQAVTTTLPPLLKVISTISAWVGLASLVILGYCLGYVGGWAYSSKEGPYMPDRSRFSSYIIRGLSIQVGLTFLTAAIGKSLNMVNMKDFFISSGYSLSFLYVIMAIESVFGLLLLFNLNF
jgi:hypothetical protein